MRGDRAIAVLLVLVAAIPAAACTRAAPRSLAPAPVSSAAAPSAAAASGPSVAATPSPTATPGITSYGFAIDAPPGATWKPIGLLATQADANSGALDATSGKLALVLVWNAGFHDAGAALQAGFAALGTRGATATTGAGIVLAEGNLDAVGQSFQLETTTGTAEGFAAAWGCGQPQRTFALVARGAPAGAQQAIRTLLGGFRCQQQ